MAYIAPEYTAEGVDLEVLILGDNVKATVCKPCLYDSRNLIPRGLSYRGYYLRRISSLLRMASSNTGGGDWVDETLNPIGKQRRISVLTRNLLGSIR